MRDRNLITHNNWKTPAYIYDPLNKEFNFDFDPCPLNDGEITPDKDGLLIEWGKVNFVNPPYSQKLKEAFIKRAIEFSNSGSVCVCLIPVSTSTELYHDFIAPNAKEIRFVRGRIRFEGNDGYGNYITSKGGMHDSMIVIFGDRQRGLTNELR